MRRVALSLLAAAVLAACGTGVEGSEGSRADATTATGNGMDEGTQQLGPIELINTDPPDDIEEVLAFAVGGDGSGCGNDGPVTTFEGVYYRDDPHIDDPGFIEGAEIGWPLIFCLPGDDAWTIRVTRPDGRVEELLDLTFEYFHEFLPGDPVGTWIFEAQSGAEVLMDEIEVRHATVRRIGVIDGSAYLVEPGDVASYSLAGFAPSTTVTIAVYEATESFGEGAFVGYLEVPVDETGAARFDLVVPEHFTPGGYYLVPDPSSAEAKELVGREMNRMTADLVVE